MCLFAKEIPVNSRRRSEAYFCRHFINNMKKFNRKEIFKAVDESNKRFDSMSKEERQKLRNEIKSLKCSLSLNRKALKS